MYSFNLFSFLSLLVSEYYFGMGLFIFFKNPKSRANQLFTLIAVSMTVWGVGEGMQRAAINPNTALFWATYTVGMGSVIHSTFLLHFWLIFSGQLHSSKWKMPIWVIYLPSLLFLFIRFLFPQLLISGVIKEYWGFSTVGTPLYLVFMLYVFIYSSIVVCLSLMASFRASGKLRQQYRNISLGIMFSLLVSGITQVSRPILHLKIPELTVVSTVVFISLIAYTVNKYGLLVISTKLVAENILGTMEDFVLALDNSLNIVYTNKSVQKYLGFSESDLLNQPYQKIVNIDFSALKFPVQNLETQMITKSGENISVSVSASELREKTGELVGYIFVLRDARKMNDLVKNLKQNSTELEQSKQKLEVNLNELERFNKLMVDRELKMMEMKKYITDLESRLPHLS